MVWTASSVFFCFAKRSASKIELSGSSGARARALLQRRCCFGAAVVQKQRLRQLVVQQRIGRAALDLLVEERERVVQAPFSSVVLEDFFQKLPRFRLETPCRRELFPRGRQIFVGQSKNS